MGEQEEIAAPNWNPKAFEKIHRVYLKPGFHAGEKRVKMLASCTQEPWVGYDRAGDERQGKQNSGKQLHGLGTSTIR